MLQKHHNEKAFGNTFGIPRSRSVWSDMICAEILILTAAETLGASFGPNIAASFISHYRRWRKLEGSDPSTFELIQKVQLLHRRLIRGSEMVVERDLQIREKEQLCLELQAFIKRSPGAEAGRTLLLTQVPALLGPSYLHARH